VAYYLPSSWVLRYAQWFYNPSPPASVPFVNLEPLTEVHPHFFTSGWSKTDVTAGQDIAVRTSIELDLLGNPIILYYDKNQGYFRFARWSTP